MLYAEFKYRYAILAAEQARYTKRNRKWMSLKLREKSARKASEEMLKKLVETDVINVDNFKTGETKVSKRKQWLNNLAF